MIQEQRSEHIGSAQFLDKGIVHCVTKDGKAMRPLLETSVKDFVETKLRKKQINDTTIIFANGQKKTVKELKQEFGMNSWWYKIRRKFFS